MPTEEMAPGTHYPDGGTALGDLPWPVAPVYYLAATVTRRVYCEDDDPYR